MNILEGLIISISIPGSMVLLMWLNSLWFERERKLILAGKKKPWAVRNAERKRK